MKLTQLEQSGILIETDKGFTLAIDIGAFTPAEKLEGILPNAMLVSHIHKDHFSPDQIRTLSPRMLYMGRECIEEYGTNSYSDILEVKAGDIVDLGEDLNVSLFEVDHGPNVTVKPEQNFGFLVTADGMKIYFGGDIFYPSGIDVSELEADIVLLPVGGHYTFGPDEALAFAKQFKRIGKVIPMHHEMKPEAREQFLELCNKAGLPTEKSAVL